MFLPYRIGFLYITIYVRVLMQSIYLWLRTKWK